MRESIPLLLFPALAMGLGVVVLIWTRRRAARMLAGWADAGGYRLLRSEPRYLRAGPYLWRRSRSQLVYYVTVADRGGLTRSGYVRLGHWFAGLLSDQVEVTWDA
jgi:hypothetical protein